jgi:signal transduction histidine kinase
MFVTPASFDGQAAELRRLTTAHRPEQADRITRDGNSSIRAYSEPLVRATKADPAFMPAATVSIEGKQRVDRIRGQFTRVAYENDLVAQRDARSAEAARGAVAVAVGGLTGSVLLIVGFSASGLIGLRDRVEALGGQIRVISPPGGGTTLIALLPSPPDDERSAGARGGAVEK